MIGEKLSFSAGSIYAIFFYVRWAYGDWNYIILWTGNIVVLLGLYLTYRESKKKEAQE